ncbi:transposase [Methylorubrum sp. Q1]|uniref:transposase n=1 Tax=Methylorubrum sp. Q1 TaxID=2562453 RepID=UPI00352C6631
MRRTTRRNGAPLYRRGLLGWGGAPGLRCARQESQRSVARLPGAGRGARAGGGRTCSCWRNGSPPARCAQVGAPEAAASPRRKGGIALTELDRFRAAGMGFGVMRADVGDGASAAFRHGLDARARLGCAHRQEPKGVQSKALRSRHAARATARMGRKPVPVRCRARPKRCWRPVPGGA